MKVTWSRALSGSPKSSYGLLTSGAATAREKKEGRAREIKAGLAAVDKEKKGGEKNATSAGYRSFVSKHDTNASLKERVPNHDGLDVAPATETPPPSIGLRFPPRLMRAHVTLCAGFRVLSTTSR